MAITSDRTGENAMKRIWRGLQRTSWKQANRFALVLEKLQNSVGPDEQREIEKIEQERSALLRRDDLLVDGSLGEIGPYDDKVIIREACAGSKARKPCLFIFLLVREFKPRQVIELGTNLGISSAYIASALKLNGAEGKLATLEASSYRLRLAEELHRRIELFNIAYVQGLFYDTLSETLGDLADIDFAFVDGHHQLQPTLDYFDTIKQHTRGSEALILLDDIRWSDGMRQAWSAIKHDRSVGVCVDMNIMGLCADVAPKSPRRHKVREFSSALS